MTHDSKDKGSHTDDQDRGKGAVEQEANDDPGNTSLEGQLGHREKDEELKDADSNLPG